MKRHNAEIHSQATLEGILELRRGGAFDARVEAIDVRDL